MLLYSFALFYFESEGKYLPRAYIRRVDLTEGDFCVTSLGGLYIEGLIFGILRYLICTIPKISPGPYIFQRPFLSALFFEGLILQSEGLIYGGKFAFQNRLGYPYPYLFLLCFTLYFRAIFQEQVPGGLYLEGRFNGGFFALPVWGAFIWRGL